MLFDRFLVVTLAVGLSASSALAQAPECLSGAASDDIYAEFDDRTVIYRVMSDGSTSETEIARDGSYVYTYHVHPIGLVLESWKLDNGRTQPSDVEQVEYTGTPPALPFPAPGVSWSGIENAVFGDGTRFRYSVSLNVMQPEQLQIGGCSYEALPVEITRVEIGTTTTQNDLVAYLPDLRIAMFMGYSDTGTPIRDLPLSLSTRPPGYSGPAAGSGTPNPSSPLPPK